MKYIIVSLLLVSAFGFPFPGKTNFELKGKITDAKSGAPVAYATITVKSSTESAVTKEDGTFSIHMPDNATAIIVNAVGYQQQEIKIKQNKFISIKLAAIENKEEEVVVSAYGTSDRMSKALSGKAPGLINAQRTRSNGTSPYVQHEFNTEDYDGITENRFLEASSNPLSTFSIDVDGASYSNVRRFLNNGTLPPAGSVRVEELINYFRYDYPQPEATQPFSINTEAGECPWNTKHHLVMIGLQGKKISTADLPASNLVFLIDVSGSMMDENKLPLVKTSIKLLVEQLREQDRVSLVVYAGNAGLVLPSTSGDEKQKIIDAVNSLEAGGSTAGGAGIKLAYNVARKNFVQSGNNRVILCTDGDFNVGVSSDAELERMIEDERKSGVFLTVLGYGTGNYKDNKMQKLSGKGNGNHAYIDNMQEAKKVLVNEFGGTLFTIAKDVKLQVEFNPAKIQAYRLVGYENRMLKKEDFNNDKKDAGEIGSGHTVTALYEIIPAGVTTTLVEKTDPLRYQDAQKSKKYKGEEIMNIKIRYKDPAGDNSRLIEHPVAIHHAGKASDNFRFVSAVAQYGMLLCNSEFKQQSSFTNAIELARSASRKDQEGYRREFIELLKKAAQLSNGEGVSMKMK